VFSIDDTPSFRSLSDYRRILSEGKAITLSLSDITNNCAGEISFFATNLISCTTTIIPSPRTTAVWSPAFLPHLNLAYNGVTAFARNPCTNNIHPIETL